MGVGTGGTITGTARFLKERNPDLVVVGADPYGSIYSAAEVKPYLIEGVGEDFWPATFDPSVVDRYVTVTDKEAFLATRRLAEVEGILTGGSGGMAVHAALEVARGIDDPAAMVAVVLPDGGRSYLSKIFNDAWMTQHGFLERAGGHDRRRRPAGQAGRAARSRRWSASAPTTRSATRSRCCTSTGSPSSRSSARTTRRRSSARSASAACSAAPPRTRPCSARRSSTSWRRRSRPWA